MKLINLIKEQLNNSKAYRITINNIKGSKYMYMNMITGVLATLVNNYNLPLNQNTINDMKDAFIDYFYDGVEPENWNDKQWKWWDNLSPNYFNYEMKKTGLKGDKKKKSL